MARENVCRQGQKQDISIGDFVPPSGMATPLSTSAKDFVNSQFGLPSPQDSPNAARVVAGSMRNDESDPATDTAISSVAISG
jgi:hypothetical protein